MTSGKVYRGEKEDKVTPLVESLVEEAGHRLVYKRIVSNDPLQLLEALGEALRLCDVVVVSGGTGPSSRDNSIDVVSSIARRELRGFGELFRYLTYIQGNTSAWLSRASAYIVGDSLVVVTPGSPDAVELALRKILLPEIRHVVAEIKR